MIDFGGGSRARDATAVMGSGVNPTLTAMAIASRAADHIVAAARRGDA